MPLSMLGERAEESSNMSGTGERFPTRIPLGMHMYVTDQAQDEQYKCFLISKGSQSLSVWF